MIELNHWMIDVEGKIMLTQTEYEKANRRYLLCADTIKEEIEKQKEKS